MREGRRPRAFAQVEDISSPGLADLNRQISTWSLAILATIAVGCVLYIGREVFLPITAAFIVGVMLSPLAARLETIRFPRPLSAILIVFGVTMLLAAVVDLVMPRLNDLTNALPTLGESLKEKLHALDWATSLWDRWATALGMSSDSLRSAFPSPNLAAWVPSTLGVLLPPITEFLFFLVVLLLFISEWPDLRRALVMTFASRDSRLTVLKILNEIEAALAHYLLTVTLINVAVGVFTGVVCALSGTPHAVGFGALAATLNFVPFLGPVGMFLILLLVGVLTASTLSHGLIAAAGFTVIVIVEGQFVTPSIIGRQLELNALAVILSFAFWTWLWGPAGALLSSPLLIVALVIRQRLAGEEQS
ncbi:MAG: AI-2E family transporter [Hyphomicrobiales bacterium]|nr:AI-2E family transporter [Hyphomicrobiales bacterium]